MGIRYLFNQTKEIVEKTSECFLLGYWYSNGRKQLLLKCKCGNSFQTDWRMFTRKDAKPITECEKCRKQHKNKSSKIGKQFGDFIIINSFNSDGKTLYVGRCIHCNETYTKGRTMIDHGICDCQKKLEIAIEIHA